MLEATCERLVPSAHGAGLFAPSTPLVYDLNFLWVHEPGGLDADSLVAEAEALHSEAGTRHRRIRVDDEAEGPRLGEAFARLDWQVQRHLVMPHQRAPDRLSPGSAREVSPEELLEPEAAYLRTEPWARDEAVVSQLTERSRMLIRAVSVRAFAAYEDGRLVSFCKLFSGDGIGQVEDVATLPEHRGRGHARAVVTAALTASQEAGHELTFLIADADDWPQVLYHRLGFEPGGLVHLFTRRG